MKKLQRRKERNLKREEICWEEKECIKDREKQEMRHRYIINIHFISIGKTHL